MTQNVKGTVTSWTSGSGSIKTEDGKSLSFVQQDIAPTRCTQKPSFSITVFNNVFQCMLAWLLCFGFPPAGERH